MILSNLSIVLITILSVVFGCGNSVQYNQEIDLFDIQGKWVVNKIELITDPSLLMPSGTMDLISLFGTEIWTQAEGKYFEFRENDVLRTDMLDNDPSLSREMAELAEMTDKIEFRYRFNTDLVIVTYFENEIIYESPVKVLNLEKEKMVWDIGGLYKITLLKEQK